MNSLESIISQTSTLFAAELNDPTRYHSEHPREVSHLVSPTLRTFLGKRGIDFAKNPPLAYGAMLQPNEGSIMARVSVLPGHTYASRLLKDSLKGLTIVDRSMPHARLYFLRPDTDSSTKVAMVDPDLDNPIRTQRIQAFSLEALDSFSKEHDILFVAPVENSKGKWHKIV